MKIAILLPGFSSDERDAAIPVQLDLVREMAKQHEVRVLALRYPHRRDVYEVYGARVYSLGVGQVRGVGRLRLWMDALRLLRQMHREDPFDVFHAMWADETGLLASWAGRILGVPSVVSVAGGELVGFDDIDYGLQRGAFSRWTVRQALEGADSVVVACEYIRRMLVDYRIRRIEKIVLGVDTSLFTPKSDASESHRLVHVASLVGVKDQTTLLKAIARLPNVKIDIVGVGPQQAYLESFVRDWNLWGRVGLHGAVSHDDLPAYYQRAALHILSSRHEGLGMVTLEAAACGVPSVSTAVGLLPDCPEMGVCVSVGDDAALAQAIADLLQDEAKRAALGASALKSVQEYYTIQHTVKQFTTLYKSLIG